MTKFASRKVATERIWKAIQGLGGPAVESSAEGAETSLADGVLPATGEAAETVATDDAPAAKGATSKAKSGKKATPAKKAARGAKSAKPTKSAKSDSGPREGSKTAQVIAMLQRKNGATLSDIMSQVGWQKHTVRGFMAGAMKKAGYTVESFKPEGGERSYRING